MTENEEARVERRSVLKTIAIAGAAQLSALPLGSVEARAQQIDTSAPKSKSQPPQGYQSLDPSEAAFVEALVNVMCPADQYTPSGVDCGLALFIDRQLAGGFGRGDRLYSQGPWRPGKPEFGYQLPLTPERYFKAGLVGAQDACKKQFGKSFEALSVADANNFLQQIASNKVTGSKIALGPWFRELVYPLFTQACFADPIYGGNQDKLFWKLIGYPGLPALYRREVVEFRGKPFPGNTNPQSIADFS